MNAATYIAPLANDEVPGQIKFQCSGWGQPVINEAVELA
jgi:hypothetical protein